MTTQRMRAENDFVQYKIIGIDATATGESSNIDVFKTTSGSWQIIWAGFTGTADIEMQSSHDDGVTWDTISGSTFTTAGASGSTGMVMNQVPGAYIRLAVTSAATAGTIDLYFVGKEEE